MKLNAIQRDDILERTKKVLSQYGERHGGTFQDDEETMMTDILADFMHFCDEIAVDFNYCLRVAQDHYKEEK
jgi:hypothetical protein